MWWKRRTTHRGACLPGEDDSTSINGNLSLTLDCLLPSSARRLYVRAYQIQRRDITSPLRFESSLDLFLFCYFQLSISMRLYNNNNRILSRPSTWLHLPEEAHSKQLCETLMTLVQALDVQYFFSLVDCSWCSTSLFFIHNFFPCLFLWCISSWR